MPHIAEITNLRSIKRMEARRENAQSKHLDAMIALRRHLRSERQYARSVLCSWRAGASGSVRWGASGRGSSEWQESEVFKRLRANLLCSPTPTLTMHSNAPRSPSLAARTH